MRTTILYLAALLAAPLMEGCAAAAPASSPETPAAVQPGAGQGAPETPRRRLAADRAWVIFEADTVEVEIADTDAEREKGLMDRTSVPDGTGMLFTFKDEEVRSFWMENTYVDLDVGFFNANLRLFDIQAMEKETTDAHDSRGPAQYALEVRKGWFAERGIRVGARARLLFGPR